MAARQRVLTEGLLRRCRLLDAARGNLKSNDEVHTLPTFSLKKNHLGNFPSASPSDFHKTLCHLIENARERVLIASLYIGPAVNHPKEKEFLQALSLVSKKEDVSVNILLDQNRALRPVPTGKNTTTSSAQAVKEAIQQVQRQNNNVHLFQILQRPLDSILPNPLNEVAGVFHIKAYIIDDNLILSGANLSEEYFRDRQDRYLWIQNGGNGLVDFYSKLLEILCRHSEIYGDKRERAKSTRSEFLHEIKELLRDEQPTSAQDLLLSDPETVAVCIPTFHPPQGFWPKNPGFISDVEATLKLLEEGHFSKNACVQLSSAYLNPTSELVEALSHYAHVDLLTAGRVSHGFHPKTKPGNQGKGWIPTAYDHLVYEISEQIKSQVHHWERPDWTFHAKGIWIQQDQQLLAAIVGSSNFGGRSFVRDMESNVIFVFPPQSSLAQALQSEWNSLLASSRPIDTKEMVESNPPLPIHIKSLLPYIKSFF